MERRVILGTAGHIDHGKTALVRALTGVDTDRLPEEKRRGITIDLGFAPLRLDDGAIAGVVDVPGHEAFVRTMLAGASGIDLALLVVAADEGVMPQTREHVAILGLLGVRGGIVALTKRDLVDDDWLELVRDDLRSALAGSPLAGAPVIPTSVVTGEGIGELRTSISRAFTGLPRRDAEDLFRMPVDRAFTVRGTGTVVTGTVWSGTLSRESLVRVLPSGRPARVRGVQSHGAAVDSARPGMRAAIALAGVELGEVARGTVLVVDEEWGATELLRADVALLADAAMPLRSRTRVRLHLGTQEVGARVVTAGELAPGGRAPARIRLDAPVVARAGDRFVLRTASPMLTIGGGVITDPLPSSRRVRPIPVDVASPHEKLALMLREAGTDGVRRAALAVRLGIPKARIDEVIAQGPAPVQIGDLLFDRGVCEALGTKLLEAVEEHHRRAPLEPGASLQAVRAGLRASFGLVDEVLRVAISRGAVEVDGAVVRKRGWVPALSERQRTTLAELRNLLDQAGREPPGTPELVARFGNDVPALLRILEREGVVVQVEEERYYGTSALESLIGSLRSGMERGREYAPADLRELLGVSRKFLIPLLEYCDRRGITDRRVGGRVLGGT